MMLSVITLVKLYVWATMVLY